MCYIGTCSRTRFIRFQGELFSEGVEGAEIKKQLVIFNFCNSQFEGPGLMGSALVVGRLSALSGEAVAAESGL